MENQVYNPANYERASIEEYGYKEHKALKITWSIISKVLVVFAIFMLYFSVIVIAIQSFNSSDSTTEFKSFTFDNYISMFTKRSLNDSILNTFKTSIFATLIATVLGTLVAIGTFYLPPKIKNRLTLLNNHFKIIGFCHKNNHEIYSDVSCIMFARNFYSLNEKPIDDDEQSDNEGEENEIEEGIKYFECKLGGKKSLKKEKLSKDKKYKIIENINIKNGVLYTEIYREKINP
jgi:hypothetical protein